MGKEILKNQEGTALLIRRLGKFEHISPEELKTVNRFIKGVAPVTVSEKWKRQLVTVNCTGWYPLSGYMTRPMDARTAFFFIWGTLRIARRCEQYGLRIDSLSWDPDRIFVDGSGRLVMVYWPVVTLEKPSCSPMSFYSGFCQILSASGLDPSITDAYRGYFYQSRAFAFASFYAMVKSLLEQLRADRERGQKAQNRARQAFPRSVPAQPVAWLEEISGGKTVSLAGTQISIGRDADQCGVTLPGFDGISRRHAMILYQGTDYYLMDLGSKNGTYIGDVRLQPRERVKLSDGDSVRFGAAGFRFRMDGGNRTIYIHSM